MILYRAGYSFSRQHSRLLVDVGNLRKAYGTTVTWPILSCLLTLMTDKIYPSSINSSTFLGCVTQPLWEVIGKVRAFMGTVTMSMMSMCPFFMLFLSFGNGSCLVL